MRTAWKLTPDRGYYRLTTKWRGDDMCLDVINDGKRNDRLQLAPCGNYAGQYWKVTPEKGYYRLTTEWRGDDMCLDIINDAKDKTPHLAKCGNYKGQLWRIAPL